MQALVDKSDLEDRKEQLEELIALQRDEIKPWCENLKRLELIDETLIENCGNDLGSSELKAVRGRVRKAADTAQNLCKQHLREPL